MIKKFFRELYPLTKVYIALSLILSAFIIPNDVYGYMLIIICGIIVFFFDKLDIYIKRIFFSLFFLTLIIFIAQSILLPSEEIWVKYGFITIYKK